MEKLIITTERLTQSCSKGVGIYRKQLATLALVLGLGASAATAMACSPVSDTADSTATTYLWALNIPAGVSALPGSCTTAMDGVVASLDQAPQTKIEILTYSDAYGSSSMALAQLSKLSQQLTEALLRSAQKIKVKVITSYGLDSETKPDAAKPLTGRIVLRLIAKN